MSIRINNYPFFDKRIVAVIAHRGGKGLWPENTLFAFESAIKIGVDILEMDVRVTKDGQLVVIHDDRVERTTNGKGMVSEMSLEAIKKLDAAYYWKDSVTGEYPYRGKGIQIPTLIEVFEKLPEAKIILEIKKSNRKIIGSLCELISFYGKRREVIISSFRNSLLREFRNQCNEIVTAGSLYESFKFYVSNFFNFNSKSFQNIDLLHIPVKWNTLSIILPSLIYYANTYNIKVNIWTVNSEEEMNYWLKFKIAGIITDYPDILLNILSNSNKFERQNN